MQHEFLCTHHVLNVADFPRTVTIVFLQSLVLGSLTNEELEEHWSSILPELNQIANGTLQTPRSLAYRTATPGQRHRMFLDQWQFSASSFQYLYDKVVHERTDLTQRSFYDTVLVPELHIRICMKVTGRSYDDAVQFMHNDYVVRL